MSTTTDPLAPVLAPTEFLDWQHPAVQSFAQDAAGDARDPTERAVRLYYAVRDGLQYEVFGQSLTREGLRASTILARGEGFCAHKSILYAAAARALGIPSRVAVGEVRNHLSSPRLQALVGGDLFVHWFASIHLEGRWLDVTPVFNGLLCRLYGLPPLEFDGTGHAKVHPYRDGAEMEFVTEHGAFDDVEYDHLIGLMRARHPGMFAADGIVPAPAPAPGLRR
ncbi:transglutaminase-like domain-containing protein [Patulibacter sp. NPDC049589]|uniref:transglutaminase-like domain-containing protein n=1 Tax=Patulibacter sp. NPDC049589 TaxID=3154731 RepID=UPI00342C9394